MAAKVAITRVHTGDRVADDAQRQAQRASLAVNLCPFINGVLIRAQTMTVASKTFNHGLGRIPQGCLVLNSTAAIAVGFPATQPSDRTKQSNLTATAAATADLWFF